MMKTNRSGAIAATIVALLLTGCAAGPTGPDASSAPSLAQARWDALLQKDYETAYGYYSPGYRQAVTLESFIGRMESNTVTWTSARVPDAECGPEVCEFWTIVGYSANLPLRGVNQVSSTTTVQERWIKLEDTWYFVPDRLR